MTTGTAVSVDEYLRTADKPNCEYIDGVLVQKPMPTWMHSELQYQIAYMIRTFFPRFEAMPELTVRIDAKRYLIPDLAVQERGTRQRPYAVTPIHLCIEIVSPEDRMSEVFAKCETYHEWGTLITWIVDPQSRRAWEYVKGYAPEQIASDGELRAGEIHLRVAQVFAVLD